MINFQSQQKGHINQEWPPTLLEDTLFNEDKAKAKTSRRKKMDLNLGDLNDDIEPEVKKLVYRKRDNGDN